MGRMGLSLNRIGMAGMLGVCDASYFLLHIAIQMLLIANMVPFPI